MIQPDVRLIVWLILRDLVAVCNFIGPSLVGRFESSTQGVIYCDSRYRVSSFDLERPVPRLCESSPWTVSLLLENGGIYWSTCDLHLDGFKLNIVGWNSTILGVQEWVYPKWLV